MKQLASGPWAVGACVRAQLGARRGAACGEGSEKEYDDHYDQGWPRTKLVPLTLQDGLPLGSLSCPSSLSDLVPCTRARRRHRALQVRPWARCHPLGGGYWEALDTKVEA